MAEVRNQGPMTAAERMRRYRARQRGDTGPSSWNRARRPGPKPRPPVIPEPVDCRGYALAFITVVLYVASELDRVGARGANVLELAAGYDHPVPSDLFRIRYHHGCVTNSEANRHLIDRAVRELGDQLREARGVKAGQRVRLAVPFDELRYRGEPLYRQVGPDPADEQERVQRAAAMGYESLT